MRRCPLKLEAVPREVIWGGTKLKEAYGKTAPFARIAESWELCVRPDAVCRIVGGDWDGMLLSDYLRAAGRDAVNPAWDGERFPLLIKFIDAADDLSVQVHPDSDYARQHENDGGKTEVWFVVEALPGAEIVYGVRGSVTSEELRRHMDDGTVSDVLRRVPVKAGDVFFIPAGQIHALGRGILVAEIQENSDVTYRIDDYGRRQKDGSLRKLHLAQAKDVIRIRTDDELRAMRFSRGTDAHTLAACDAFFVKRYAPGDCPVSITVGKDSFAALLCTDGKGELIHGSDVYAVRKGDCYFLPAGTGDVVLRGAAHCLVTTL